MIDLNSRYRTKCLEGLVCKALYEVANVLLQCEVMFQNPGTVEKICLCHEA